MLAEQERWLSIRDRGGGEMQRVPHLRDGPRQRMRQVDAHASGLHLRIAENLIEAVDRAAWHAHRFQRFEPVSLPARAHDRGDHRHQLVSPSHALRVDGEPRIARPFRLAGNLAEARELRVVADREEEMTVGAGEYLV